MEMQKDYIEMNQKIKYFELPLIDKNKKFQYFQKQFNNLNNNIILLNKIVINNNKSIDDDNINKIKEITRYNNNYNKKKSDLSTKYNMINSFKKSKSTNKFNITRIIKNPLPKIKSNKNLINNNKIIQSQKTISSISKYNTLLNSEKRNYLHTYKDFDKKNRYLSGPINKLKNENQIEKIKSNDLNNFYISFYNTINNQQKKEDIKEINILNNKNNNKKYNKLDKISLTPKKENCHEILLKYNNFGFPLKSLEFRKSCELKNNKTDFFSSYNNINYIKNKYNNEFIITNEKEDNECLDKKSKDIIHNKENNNMSNFITHGNIPKILINKIRELRENNLKINRNLNNVKSKFEEMNFCFGTKLKYSKWKYQISDYDKYFIDIEHFGERERKEMERKKTFYDILEDAVDSINEKIIKKKLELPSGRKKLINQYKGNKLKLKNLPDSCIAKLKQKNISLSLENVNKRMIKEKIKRHKIKEILEESFRIANDAMKI